MSDAPTERTDPLLEHLDSLYTFAQAMMLEASAAARLVEATYARAFSTPPEERPLLDEQTWLYSLMMQIRREEEAPATSGEEAGMGISPAPLSGDFRRRLAEQLVDRKLPAALATLSEDHRLLLLLCDGEGLSEREAGQVLGLDEEATDQHLEQARKMLKDLLLDSVTSVERPLIEQYLSEAGVHAALQRLLSRSEFVPLPPDLRQAVTTIAQEQQLRLRPRPRPRRPRRRSGPWEVLQRTFAALVLIGTAGLLGYAIADFSRPAPDTNLITLSARQANDLQPTFRTGSAEQAERFIQDRMGWQLSVPAIEGTSLSGVSITEVAPGVEAPVFLFEGPSGETITLFTYSYAFLDRYDDRVGLDADVLRQIEDDRHFDLYDLEADKVLVWRNRDDIYLAVTRGDAESLSERIFF